LKAKSQSLIGLLESRSKVATILGLMRHPATGLGRFAAAKEGYSTIAYLAAYPFAT
jgi:hypothetical protein